MMEENHNVKAQNSVLGGLKSCVQPKENKINNKKVVYIVKFKNLLTEIIDYKYFAAENMYIVMKHFLENETNVTYEIIGIEQQEDITILY